MKSHGKRIPAIGILLGLALFVTALVLAAQHLIPIKAFGILFLSGYVIYLCGCAALAKAKGHAAAQGILLGVIFPAVLVFLMPDRTQLSKAQRTKEDREDAEEQKAQMAARRRPLKGGQKALAWLVGGFFVTVGLAMIVGYEIYWARVVVPERNGMANAISISADKLDPQNDGKLVHVTGTLNGCQPLSDPELGVTVNALKLRRRVWMYQWQQGGLQSKSSYGVEDSHGNTTTLLKTRTYNYTREWSEKVISSRSFYNAGHDNPDQKGIPDFAVAAAPISLGGFHVTPELVEQLENFQTAPVNTTNLATVAEPLKARAKLADGEIFFGADPANPAIGDLKVKMEFAPATNVSVIAKQNGNDLSPYAIGKSGSIAQLRAGTFSVPEMTGQFAKTEFQSRALVWVFGGFAILMGTIFIQTARRR
jgi:Ca2+/Na+ antiporter